MQKILGTETSEQILSRIKDDVGDFERDFGRLPCLAVVLVGDDPASVTYVTSKRKACDSVGMMHKDYTLPSIVSESELLELVRSLNRDDSVDGILVQLPLPEGIDSEKVTESISPAKDVDGLHPENIGKLLTNQPCIVSCTPKGIMVLLDKYGIETSGKHAVIIGRNTIVSKPVAALLLQYGRDATVTICHRKTENLAEITRQADILISVAGVPSLISADMVKDGAVVIDVGITRVADSTKKKGFRLVGDVDFDSVAPKCSYITPVPGGVGPMTIAMLLDNTVAAGKKRMADALLD